MWADEVDHLLVLVNGGDPELLQPLFDHAADAKEHGGLTVWYEPNRVGHGEALKFLLEQCSDEEVVLVEDDAYVRFPGRVNAAFTWRQPVPGVVLGSPRGGYSAELGVAATERWGPSVGPDTSSGHGLWPCFLFADRADLLAVAHLFPAQTWRAGTTVPGLDYVCPSEMHTDTFSAAAFVLRDTRPVVPVPQYKEIEQKLRVVENRAPWFHAGGLSNLDPVRGVVGNLNRGIAGTNDGLDWASRVWWWRRCLDTAGPDLDDLKDGYRATLDSLVAEAGIASQVEEWDAVYPACITWDDNYEGRTE